MATQHDTDEASDAIADALTERLREHREKKTGSDDEPDEQTEVG
jgi:hypothetical protein